MAAIQGRTVYVVDGARTPFLKTRGAPGSWRASDLAVAAGRSLLLRQSCAPTDLDEVILGCVMPGPDEVNIARVVALRLQCGPRVTAWTVQRNCASGMQSLDSARQRIASGAADLILAGGVEAMSHAPLLHSTDFVTWLTDWRAAKKLPDKLRQLGRLRPKMLTPVIGLLRGLTDPIVGLSMGQTAENLAFRCDISRAAMDAFALESHARIAAAQDAASLSEIVPLFDARGKAHEADDGLRRDTTLEQLAKLRPVFDRPYGLVTAGNSAQITDGAALLLLASEDAVARHRLPVLGRLVDCAWAGVAPEEMGLGPVNAMAQLMARQSLGTEQVDYWEINEAFAAQVLACLAAWQDDEYARKELGLDAAYAPIPKDRLNVDGGAIALGHPVGASGARIVLHLLHVLKRHDARRGVASLCIGGGQGGAMLVERGSN
jgi:acetyl-CoA C-acetyltransferase